VSQRAKYSGCTTDYPPVWLDQMHGLLQRLAPQFWKSRGHIRILKRHKLNASARLPSKPLDPTLTKRAVPVPHHERFLRRMRDTCWLRFHRRLQCVSGSPPFQTHVFTWERFSIATGSCRNRDPKPLPRIITVKAIAPIP
jgi:hypothetical protein